MKHIRLWWLLILVAAILVYFPSLTTFFSQDDFTHLYISQASTLKEFINLFKPVEIGIYYRPLSIQLYTFISQQLFGLNPMGFHALALGLHLINIYLVYLILIKLLKDKTLGLIGAFAYGVHASHFMSIFWIAEFSMVLAPFFAFLAILSFINKKNLQFIIFMTLGMLSNELVITVPIILGYWVIMQKEYKSVKYLIAGLLIAAVVPLIRFVWFPTSLGSEYLLSFDPILWIKNIRWYFYRSLGMAEGFRAHLDMWQIKLSLILFISVFIAIIKNARIKSKLFWLGIGWFIISLLPVMPLQHHHSPIYQIIGLPGMILAILSLLPRKLKFNWKIAIVLGLYFTASLLSVRAMEQYHWVTKKARIAKYHINKLKYLNLEKNSVVSFINTTDESSLQAYLALSGNKAIKLFFDKSIEVTFEDFGSISFTDKTIYIFAHEM